MRLGWFENALRVRLVPELLLRILLEGALKFELEFKFPVDPGYCEYIKGVPFVYIPMGSNIFSPELRFPRPGVLG